MSGFEVATALKADKVTREIPILALNRQELEQGRQGAAQSGRDERSAQRGDRNFRAHQVAQRSEG